MDKNWVVICSANREVEGDIIKGRLESEGIPVMLRQKATGEFYAFDVLGEVEILVPSALKEKALEIIGETARLVLSKQQKREEVVPKESEINAEDEEKSLCTNCGTPNILMEDFCTNCGCPLNSYAQIDPIKRIRTYGFMFRSMVNTPDRPIILVGGWILLAPLAIYYYLLIATGGYTNFDEFFCALLICIFCFSVLFLLTKNYFVRRKHK